MPAMTIRKFRPAAGSDDAESEAVAEPVAFVHNRIINIR